MSLSCLNVLSVRAIGCFCFNAIPNVAAVVKGYEIVEKIENTRTGPMDRPVKEVKIEKSGELPKNEV